MTRYYVNVNPVTVLMVFAVLLVLALLMGGCRTYQARDAHGNKIAVTVLLSDTQIEDLAADFGEGRKLRITGYRSEAEKVAGAVAEGVARGLKP